MEDRCEGVTQNVIQKEKQVEGWLRDLEDNIRILNIDTQNFMGAWKYWNIKWVRIS